MNSSLSIIIPTYNEAVYLPRLLDSIAQQTLKPKEVIVVDALSKDGTSVVAKKYPFATVLQKKGGPAIQRNYGARFATGDMLLFLDADVILASGFLADIVAEATRRKIEIGSCFVRPLSSKKIDLFLHQLVNYYLMLTKPFFLHAPGFCILVSRKIHERIEGFDESLYLAEDHDYVQRAAKFGTFGYLHSQKIAVSIRRLEEEGRWAVAKKYIFSELYLLFKGKIRKKIYRYKFGKHS